MPQPQAVSKAVDETASAIVDSAFKVHTTLGPGLLESVYEVCLAHELKKRGHSVDRQVATANPLLQARPRIVGKQGGGNLVKTHPGMSVCRLC